MAKRLRKEEQIMPDIRILTEGDSSVLVEFGKEISPEINRKITATVQLMKEQHIEGVVDMIPAFCSLLVNYDPRVISYDDLKKRLEILLKMEVTAGEGAEKFMRFLYAMEENMVRILRILQNMPDFP